MSMFSIEDVRQQIREWIEELKEAVNMLESISPQQTSYENILLIKEELKEKMLRYGFSSLDMTVTEFVDDFFKKYLK